MSMYIRFNHYLTKKKLTPSSCVQNIQSNNALISGKPRTSDTLCDNVGDIREHRQQTHKSNTEMVTYLKSCVKIPYTKNIDMH